MDQFQQDVTTQSPDGSVQETTRVTATAPSAHEVRDEKVAKKNQIVWYLVGIVNTLLVLRIIFKMFDAREVGFTSALYSVTDPLAAPFTGIFPAPEAGGAYFDTGALAAIILYSLIAWGIAALIEIAGRPATSTPL